ncbi:Hypothetical_protein [Hexamita inflata]|uniref:Hypothetical_protein n=1 Tax=Hexamita inflata TaxID=28002 RepID=A0AA86R6J4_9EUKA|nr:Hypothetical protein HINF_LOCUS57358 [Hexamita inflata]
MNVQTPNKNAYALLNKNDNTSTQGCFDFENIDIIIKTMTENNTKSQPSFLLSISAANLDTFECFCVFVLLKLIQIHIIQPFPSIKIDIVISDSEQAIRKRRELEENYKNLPFYQTLCSITIPWIFCHFGLFAHHIGYANSQFKYDCTWNYDEVAEEIEDFHITSALVRLMVLSCSQPEYSLILPLIAILPLQQNRFMSNLDVMDCVPYKYSDQISENKQYSQSMQYNHTICNAKYSGTFIIGKINQETEQSVQSSDIFNEFNNTYQVSCNYLLPLLQENYLWVPFHFMVIKYEKSSILLKKDTFITQFLKYFSLLIDQSLAFKIPHVLMNFVCQNKCTAPNFQKQSTTYILGDASKTGKTTQMLSMYYLFMMHDIYEQIPLVITKQQQNTSEIQSLCTNISPFTEHQLNINILKTMEVFNSQHENDISNSQQLTLLVKLIISNIQDIMTSESNFQHFKSNFIYGQRSYRGKSIFL